MAKAKRKFILVGNWKMNPDTLEEAKSLKTVFDKQAKKVTNVSVLICPPAVFIKDLAKAKKNKKSSIGTVKIGAQDVDYRPRGSFTGSVSAAQIHNVGAEYTIIGHSEKRASGDTNEIVAQKISQAFSAGLKVILCVGENERDNHGNYLRVVREQIIASLHAIDKKSLKSIIVAYEPVWAIGKDYNVALSPSDIHEMSIYIKKVIAEIAGKEIGLKTQVLYGGSVDFDNAQKILSDGAIDGLLIGRQSLDKDNFSKIIEYAGSI